ncbi:flagellar assembly protein FliW [Geobacter sulfurreducens]|uniref:flagellar assembly protein FliW n=1 Tax=Geobacter sulfurreducens TaxID=35554 RepID=UPI000DBBAE7F|nr:flagellar assembly protein FliW [Geobacter sulfurreducens]BBA71441.1 Flagellar assembly factor FliW [Geobacter sulfurreducens]
MNVTTTRFGEIAVEEAKIITLPDGMLGFSEKRFVLLTPQNITPFCWLQSVENPELAFVVVDTKECAPDYAVKLTAEESEKLCVNDGDEVVLLAVVTMAADPFDITVNLQGPIALNPKRMLAKQIVLEGSRYVTKHPFFDQAARSKAPGKRNASGEVTAA